MADTLVGGLLAIVGGLVATLLARWHEDGAVESGRHDLCFSAWPVFLAADNYIHAVIRWRKWAMRLVSADGAGQPYGVSGV